MEKPKVGIPRALLYYQYYPLWKQFFESLGAEVILSDKTTKEILNNGVRNSVEDACLPVKLFVGHVENLRDRVDYLFVPRIVSVESKEYICPKFLGLPDMIKSAFKELPPVIDTTIDLNKKSRNLYKCILEAGSVMSDNPVKIAYAYNRALKSWQLYKNYLIKGMSPLEAIKALEKGEQSIDKNKPKQLTIALIGHSYNLYDDYINMNIFQKLRKMGVKVVTPENLPEEYISEAVQDLPKKLFWTMGKHLLGSALHYAKDSQIDGIIHLTAFGCGIDSIVGELMERKIRKGSERPFMVLTLDEHTGEAGVVTRLEAFVDMIRWRERGNESNFSTHG